MTDNGQKHLNQKKISFDFFSLTNKSVGLALSLLLVIFFFLQLISFLDLPVIWSDEAIYTDLALNFINDGVFKTSLWQGLLKGVEDQALWYPPFFLLTIAGWFRIFPVTAVNLRLLPFIFAIFFLILIWKLSLEQLKFKKISALLLLLLIISDLVFLQASHLCRPEIFILCLLFLILNLLFKSHELRRSNFLTKLKSNSLFKLFDGFFIKHLSRIRWLLIGLLSAAICLMHYYAILLLPIVIVYWILKWQVLFKAKNDTEDVCSDTKSQRFRKLLGHLFLFLIGFGAPLLWWMLRLMPHLDLFQLHLELSAQRKALERVWLLDVFRYQSWVLRLIYLNYLIMIGATIWQVFKNRDWRLHWLVFSCVWLLGVTAYGKMLWYFVYLIPFVYLGIVYVWQISPVFNWKNKLIIFFLFFHIILNLQQILSRIHAITSRNFSYSDYSKQVLTAVPEGKTVFLSALPDPYFAFIEAGRNNQLIEFPTLPITKQEYTAVLEKCDYVIYNGNHDLIFGNILSDYIEENLVGLTPISYGVVVIKLK